MNNSQELNVALARQHLTEKLAELTAHAHTLSLGELKDANALRLVLAHDTEAAEKIALLELEIAWLHRALAA